MPDTTTYDTLVKGQSLEEVCQILGEPTELLSSETAQIEPGISVYVVQSDLYEWREENGETIRVLFKNNALNDKTCGIA